ncbi:MAG: class I SAM-dependent methyltransferase [Planctomycetales bacterium]|nr:class I SAM-dependent methyltransferase [Planctomycetales bacterium]
MADWIQNLYAELAPRTTGSVSKFDIGFLQQVITDRKPRRILELGVASGFSTTFITRMAIEANPEVEIYSVDFSDRFYADNTKPLGFFTQECLTDDELKHLTIRSGMTCFDVPEAVGDKRFEFVFIDANHQHPWTTLDMIGLLPVCAASAEMAFHDLGLYRHPKFRVGIGPKYLYDQLPVEGKKTIDHEWENIFSVPVTGVEYQRFTKPLVQALHLPWSIPQPLTPHMRQKIRNFIQQYWNDELLEAFDTTIEAFAHIAQQPICESYSINEPNQWCEFIPTTSPSVRLKLHPTTAGRGKQPTAVLKHINQDAKKLQITAVAANQSERNAGAVLHFKFEGEGATSDARIVKLQPRVRETIEVEIPQGSSSKPTDLHVTVESPKDAKSAAHGAVRIEIARPKAA